MRLVIVLAVAAAVTIMFGAILVAASMVMRLLTRNDPTNMVRLGLDAMAAGVAFGLVVLVIFAVARIGTAGRSRPRVATAEHRRGDPGPRPAPASHGRSPGRGTSQEQRQDRFRAGAPGPGSGHGPRSGRPSVLRPTNVYSPGGLLDVPRDGRAPGPPGGQAIPEILRTAGLPHPPPPAPPGWGGAQPPRPGYHPGMNQGSGGPAAVCPRRPAAARHTTARPHATPGGAAARSCDAAPRSRTAP